MQNCFYKSNPASSADAHALLDPLLFRNSQAVSVIMSATPAPGARSVVFSTDVIHCVVFVPISWLAVSLRIWVRWQLIASLGADDLFIVISSVTCLPYSIIGLSCILSRLWAVDSLLCFLCHGYGNTFCCAWRQPNHLDDAILGFKVTSNPAYIHSRLILHAVSSRKRIFL